MTINPYLNFKGNCLEAFTFYKSVFGGEFTYKSTFAEMPPNDACEIAEEDKSKIMHITLPIGENGSIFGCDIIETKDHKYKQGNNFSISINPDSKEDTIRLFDAFAKNGHVIMPLEDTFWNAHFGLVVDQFGIAWMLHFQYEEAK